MSVLGGGGPHQSMYSFAFPHKPRDNIQHTLPSLSPVERPPTPPCSCERTVAPSTLSRTRGAGYAAPGSSSRQRRRGGLPRRLGHGELQQAPCAASWRLPSASSRPGGADFPTVRRSLRRHVSTHGLPGGTMRRAAWRWQRRPGGPPAAPTLCTAHALRGHWRRRWRQPHQQRHPPAAQQPGDAGGRLCKQG